MRAFAVKAFPSPPELMDLPKPVPGPGEILVHLGAASVNPMDWKLTGLAEGGLVPHVVPFVLGIDGAGVVEGVGDGVSRFKIGDGVFGQFAHTPYGTGTYAEFTTAPETLGISKTPRGIYTGPASAVPTAGMTALAAVDAIGLRKGQTLLIQGAKGGVGSFATQIASNLGILVVAASRGDHGTYMRKLGAYEYFDSSRIGWTRDYRGAHPSGVDAALDLVGTESLSDPSASLVRDGAVVGSPVVAPGASGTTERGIRILPIQLQPSTSLLDRLSAEISSGRLRIPVESTVPLSEAAEAISLSRQGLGRGKTVLTI
ncbi:MAG: NADP-dependent oxidoreductase [Thermoplasmata archaeon]|nr:NADP-dependent oxidoreductase [Thermoplasmata archaeon]MCI4359296.1 NADP-dependent oxidoreductase [Thermoplasmata archaeon]